MAKRRKWKSPLWLILAVLLVCVSPFGILWSIVLGVTGEAHTAVETVVQVVDKETVEFIAAITNSKKLLEYRGNEEGGVNMCEALEQILEEGIEQGIEQGIKVLVETCQEFGMSKEETIAKVEYKFTISSEHVSKLVSEYWL